MVVTVEAPTDLHALLSVMKSARERKVGMSIWDKDIETVERAIATINAIRNQEAAELAD